MTPAPLHWNKWKTGSFQEAFGFDGCWNGGLRQVERAATGIVKAAFGGRDYY